MRRFGLVLTMAVGGFLGMGVATAVALLLYAGNRYHLSFGVDSGDDYTVHPSAHPSQRKWVHEDSVMVVDDSAPSMNKGVADLDRRLGLPSFNCELPALSQESQETGIHGVSSTRDETIGGNRRNALLTSVSSPGSAVPTQVLRQQSEEIRQLTRQVEKLQNLVLDRTPPVESHESEEHWFADTTESLDQQIRPRANVRGARLMHVDDRGLVTETPSVPKSHENYSQNCAEIEELLARLEQMEQQVDSASIQIDNDRRPSDATRDRKPQGRPPASEDDAESEVLSMLSRKSVNTRPVEMRIVPATRSPRP